MLAVLLAGACGDDDGDEQAANAGPTRGRFGCLDFVATVTSGPGTGKSWTGDLALTPDETGAFTGHLVPVGAANRETLEVTDRSRAICRAVGQRNAAQVSWLLLVGAAGRQTARAWRRRTAATRGGKAAEARADRLLLGGVAAGLVGYLVQASFNTKPLSLTLVAWTLLAVACTLSRRRHGPPDEGARRPAGRRPTAVPAVGSR